ncbi:MAG: hypothetical protein PVI78_11345 [Anaerolineales bacterium]|jgi:hypothetical protein
MTEERSNRVTLGQPSIYQIKLPGVIDLSQADWGGNLEISVESDGDGSPSTILIGELDQAGLHGLLRRLYSMGIPLISVRWIGEVSAKTGAQAQE